MNLGEKTKRDEEMEKDRRAIENPSLGRGNRVSFGIVF